MNYSDVVLLNDSHVFINEDLPDTDSSDDLYATRQDLRIS